MILAVFLAVGLQLDPSKVSSPLLGKPMPAFSGTDLENPARTITEKDFVGQAALINVWASWCVACLDEHPLLMKLVQHKSLPVYGINYKDTYQPALDWLAREGNPYKITVYDHTGQIGLNWGVYGVPETYLIDNKGIIIYKHIGPLTEAVLQERFLPLMAKMEWNNA